MTDLRFVIILVEQSGDIKVGCSECKVSLPSWRYRADDIYNMFITDITKTTITFISNANLFDLMLVAAIWEERRSLLKHLMVVD